MNATLYLVATPIGNLADISFRAITILQQVQYIFAEDTRVTSKLLTHHSITKKKLMVYNDYSNIKDREKIVELLETGNDIALVSDAGTPLISDPGYKLVNSALERKILVKSIPGPCSIISALTISGLPTNKFSFLGFLPVQNQQRINQLQNVKNYVGTLILFESPFRLVNTLQSCLSILGNREAVIVREITKIYEETKRGTLEQLLCYYEANQVKGELVILISGKLENEVIGIEEQVIIEKALTDLLVNVHLKEAVQEIASTYGISKREVYQLALKIDKNI